MLLIHKSVEIALNNKRLDKERKSGKFADGGDISENDYMYRFHEERGQVGASVTRLIDDETVWEYYYDEENNQKGETTIVEDGFIKHFEDVDGIEKYLKSLDIIGEDARVYSESKANQMGYYAKGGAVMPPPRKDAIWYESMVKYNKDGGWTTTVNKVYRKGTGVKAISAMRRDKDHRVEEERFNKDGSLWFIRFRSIEDEEYGWEFQLGDIYAKGGEVDKLGIYFKPQNKDIVLIAVESLRDVADFETQEMKWEKQELDIIAFTPKNKKSFNKINNKFHQLFKDGVVRIISDTNFATGTKLAKGGKVGEPIILFYTTDDGKSHVISEHKTYRGATMKMTKVVDEYLEKKNVNSVGTAYKSQYFEGSEEKKKKYKVKFENHQWYRDVFKSPREDKTIEVEIFEGMPVTYRIGSDRYGKEIKKITENSKGGLKEIYVDSVGHGDDDWKHWSRLRYYPAKLDFKEVGKSYGIYSFGKAVTVRDLSFAKGGSIDMDKHIFEGWTVGDIIEHLDISFKYHPKFKSRDEVKAWQVSETPYRKKYVKEVVDYYWDKNK